MVKRIKMALPLTRQIKNYPISMVPAEESHLAGMANALLDAYRDTVDDEGESLEDALAELRRVFEGLYGPLIRPASWLILDNKNRVAAGVLVCDFRGEPTVTYTFTKKKHRRLGYASMLLNKAQDALADSGHETLSLYVALENREALNLYESLGFSEVPLTSPPELKRENA